MSKKKEVDDFLGLDYNISSLFFLKQEKLLISPKEEGNLWIFTVWIFALRIDRSAYYYITVALNELFPHK